MSSKTLYRMWQPWFPDLPCRTGRESTCKGTGRKSVIIQYLNRKVETRARLSLKRDMKDLEHIQGDTSKRKIKMPRIVILPSCRCKGVVIMRYTNMAR